MKERKTSFEEHCWGALERGTQPQNVQPACQGWVSLLALIPLPQWLHVHAIFEPFLRSDEGRILYQTNLPSHFLIENNSCKRCPSSAHEQVCTPQRVTVLSNLSARYKGGVSSKPCAAMHESQSSACVCFIYSLVTRSLKRKKKKKNTRKFHSNKQEVPGARF